MFRNTLIKDMMSEHLPLIGIYSTDGVIDIFKQLVDSLDRLKYLRQGLVAPLNDIWIQIYNTIPRPLGKLLYEQVDTVWQLSYPIPIDYIVKNWLIDEYGRLSTRQGISKWKRINIDAKLTKISSIDTGVFVASELSDIWYVDNNYNIYEIQPFEMAIDIVAINDNNVPVCYILDRYGNVTLFSPFKYPTLIHIATPSKIYALKRLNNKIILLAETKQYMLNKNTNRLVGRSILVSSFNIKNSNTMDHKYAVVPLLTRRPSKSIKEKTIRISKPRLPLLYGSDINFDNSGRPRDIENAFEMKDEYDGVTVDLLRNAEDLGDALLAYDDNNNYPIF